jgi:chromosome segregation ATPase
VREIEQGLMSRLESVEDRLSHAQASVASLEVKLRDLLVEKRTFEKEAAIAAAVKDKLVAELASVTADFDSLVESSKEVERELEQEVRAAKQQTSAVQGLLEQATRLYQSAQQSVAELQQQLATVTAKRESAEKRVLKLEVECEALESKVRRFESSYERLAEKHNDALQQLAMQEAELEQGREELRKAAETAQRARLAAEEQRVAEPQKVEEKKDSAPSTIAYLCLAGVVSFIGYNMLFKQRGSS